MAMSIVFIVIELNARFERSFLIFGIANLLLSSFCAIDIWIQSDIANLYWTRIQHIIVAFFPAFIIWYLQLLLKQVDFKIITAMVIISFCFSILFFTNLMFRPSPREIASTLLYNFTFTPYLLIAIVYIISFLVKNLPRNTGNEKKILASHLIGVFLLSICGIMDMVNLFIGERILPQVSSFTSIGLLLFGFIVSYVFIDRLTVIIKEREVTFGKLQTAYKQIEEVQTLKELGQSTAIINHEIRNYTFVISGYAQYLLDRADFSEKTKKILNTIAETAKKMSDFSNEILDFSKARILSDKRPVAVFQLIKTCINTHFSDRSDSVIIDNPDYDFLIHGDNRKLEHVFVNIIKNSFEAHATQISIKAIKRDTVLLLIVEDNGKGCSEDEIRNIFKSFFTTKKSSGGTGLGMCVVKSIVEIHGGNISAYSKNVLNNGAQGLVINITFPLYNDKENLLRTNDGKYNVVLIKDGIDNLSHVIRIFQNVFVTPHIVQRVDDIDKRKIAIGKTIIYASTMNTCRLKKEFGILGNIHTLTGRTKECLFVSNDGNSGILELFSEKYIIENIHATS
jgi:signal transduction histidine kinase